MDILTMIFMALFFGALLLALLVPGAALGALTASLKITLQWVAQIAGQSSGLNFPPISNANSLAIQQSYTLGGNVAGGLQDLEPPPSSRWLGPGPARSIFSRWPTSSGRRALWACASRRS